MKTLNGKIRWLQLSMPAMLLMSLNGCSAPKVIPSSDLEHRIEAGATFTAPVAGFFMSEDRWRRYQRAVADRIQELKRNAPPN